MPTEKGRGSEGLILHEAIKADRKWQGVRKLNSHLGIKADRNWEGVRRPNIHLDIKAKILLGTNFFGELNLHLGYKLCNLTHPVNYERIKTVSLNAPYFFVGLNTPSLV